MKNKMVCVFTAMGILVSSATSSLAARVFFRDLPDPVKKSVQKSKDDIKKIETFTRNGQTIYEVQIDKKGPDTFIYVAQDGTRLNDPPLRAERKAGLASLKLTDLPQPVQQTFRQQAGLAKVSNISTDTVNGRTVYEIEFTRAGEPDELRINEDGSLPKTIFNVGSRDSINRNETIAKDSQQTVASFDRPLAATQKVDFNTLPEAVKRTAHELAGANRIEDTERGLLDGKTVYEIAFKENGKHNEVRIAEDGTLGQRMIVGYTGSVNSTQASANANIDPNNVRIEQVPESVRRAIRAQVGSGEVNDIDLKTINGRTVYEVGFKKQSGGPQHEIQIAEDGTVLGEPAGAGKK